MDVREKLVELLKKAKAKEQYDFLFGDIDMAIDMPHGAEYYADYLIGSGVTVQEWISVKDRLPQKPGKYLVYGRSFGNKAPQIWICECICIGSVMGWCNNAKNPVVEAWTTLPQPPKGE